MTVHFIGAGPGAPDLLTLRGRDPHRRLFGLSLCRLARAEGRSCALSAGRAHRQYPRRSRWTTSWRKSCPPMPRKRTSRDCIPAICRSGRRWARSCVACARWAFPIRLRPACQHVAAAAAALEAELTLPGMAQSVVLTRTSGRPARCRRARRLQPSRQPARCFRFICPCMCLPR